VYLGNSNGVPEFIANITDGIQILSKDKLAEFVVRYQVTSIERFAGNMQQRSAAVKRAFNRLGEKAYNLVFNNCEHFKNWVLYGKGISKQSVSIGTGVAIAGIAAYTLGIISESKSLKKMGILILIILVALIISAFLFWQYKKTPNKHCNACNNATC
jgi:F0F1-type ATP synthase membrane subunit c/vacuolar-type H+-ATPase subunit K